MDVGARERVGPTTAGPCHAGVQEAPGRRLITADRAGRQRSVLDHPGPVAGDQLIGAVPADRLSRDDTQPAQVVDQRLQGPVADRTLDTRGAPGAELAEPPGEDHRRAWPRRPDPVAEPTQFPQLADHDVGRIAEPRQQLPIPVLVLASTPGTPAPSTAVTRHVAHVEVGVGSDATQEDFYDELCVALVVHKAQGATVDATLVLADEGSYRESIHTGLSRGRVANWIYVVSDEADGMEACVPRPETPDGLAVLREAVARSAAQELATPVRRAHRRR